MFFRFFVLLGLLAASAEVTASETCPTNMELGNPGGADITLCHDGYAVGYSYQHKIPNVVRLLDREGNGRREC